MFVIGLENNHLKAKHLKQIDRQEVRKNVITILSVEVFNDHLNDLVVICFKVFVFIDILEHFEGISKIKN